MRKQLSILSFVVLGAFLNNSDANAQSADIRKVVESVFGNCYMNLEKIERLEAAANIFKWKPITGDMLKMFAPADGTGYKAWAFRESGETVIVAINQGTFRNRPVNVCSVVLKLTKEQFLNEASKMTSLKPAGKQDEPLQTSEFFYIPGRTTSQVMVTIISSKDNQPSINVSFVEMPD